MASASAGNVQSREARFDARHGKGSGGETGNKVTPDQARSNVSNKFIGEAASAAEDAGHAKIVAERFALLRTQILEMRSRGLVVAGGGAGDARHRCDPYRCQPVAGAGAGNPHNDKPVDLDCRSGGGAAPWGAMRLSGDAGHGRDL